MKRSLFFWPSVIFICLCILQFIPMTGIFMMMVGAPIWAGLALVIALGGLACDALIGNVRRIWLIVPISAIIGYYSLYVYQGFVIASRESELQQSNPVALLKFDPSRHSLVTSYAESIVERYHVPIAYKRSENTKEKEFGSYQLVLQEECASIREDSLWRLRKSGILSKQPNGERINNVCLLNFPDPPTKEIVEVLIDDKPWKGKATIIEDVYTLIDSGKILGKYRTASVNRYFPLPFPLIGCGLNSAKPSWDCDAVFLMTPYTLNTKPQVVARGVEENPVAIMLGLEPYTTEELKNFEGYPSNATSLAKARGEARRVEDEAYQMLDALTRNARMELPWNFGSWLAKSDERLVKEGEKVISTFLTLAKGGPLAQKNAGRVATAVAALPDIIFRPRSAEIFAVIRNDDWWERNPVLYIRAADVGKDAFPKYKDDLLGRQIKTSLRFIPVLALCRIGAVDPELLSFLKSEFSRVEDDWEYHQALFLALLRANEREFAMQNLGERHRYRIDWYREVANRFQSNSQEMPNNCMIPNSVSVNWPSGTFIGERMQGAVK